MTPDVISDSKKADTQINLLASSGSYHEPSGSGESYLVQNQNINMANANMNKSDHDMAQIVNQNKEVNTDKKEDIEMQDADARPVH